MTQTSLYIDEYYGAMRQIILLLLGAVVGYIIAMDKTKDKTQTRNDNE